ncbi:hypothetical protein HDV04_004523 [Boothiomyces sp. JEL0838]|nr:hypothetical protein HDV04_004523 [Boothiomyces sp. JEL0838]
MERLRLNILKANPAVSNTISKFPLPPKKQVYTSTEATPNNPPIVNSWINKVLPQNSGSVPVNFHITSALLSRSIRKAVHYRLKLYNRCQDLIEIHRNAVVDEEFLYLFDSLYQDIRRSTKLLQASVPDPIYGMGRVDGMMSEEEIREHLENELWFMKIGLEREMRELLSFGLKSISSRLS